VILLCIDYLIPNFGNSPAGLYDQDCNVVSLTIFLFKSGLSIRQHISNWIY